jgi:hypothetical protein
MSETETAAPQEGTEPSAPAAGEGVPHQPEPQEPSKPAEPLEQAPESPKEEPPKEQWWQKRISEIARQKHEATRKAEQAERERDFYRQQVEQRQGQDPNAQPQPARPGVPLTEQQIEERANAIAAQREFERARDKTLAAGSQKFGDPAFLAACNTLASLGANEIPAFMQAVTGLDSGADVLQHLGTHPEIAARIMAMPPVRMAVELGRLEARVTTPAPAKPLSRAPAPIAPLEGGVSPSEPDIYDPEISNERFIALRNKQENARRGRS